MMAMMIGSANYGVGRSTGAASPDSDLMTSMHSTDPPSPAGQSDSSNSPTSPPSHQRGIPKECGVCSDVAKSMHFGGLSCDSCKAFFRRSVQNNAYKGFSCPYERKCVIGVSSRKACQYCRFEKCLTIGMEKGWVMSEEERRKMMEQRKDKKSKTVHNVSQSRQQEADLLSIYKLSDEDRSEISSIINIYKKADVTVQYENPEDDDENVAREEVMHPWMTFCKKMAFFFSLFPDFAELSSKDQRLLLTTAITSAGIIMGSIVYDSNNGKWATKGNKTNKGYVPSVNSQSVEKLVPGDLFSRVSDFFKKFKNICPDETMAYILILISLYSPELMGLEARDKVQNLQERYIQILRNYVRFKYRERSSIMFPKAIVSLADIRELADRTSQIKVKLERRPANRSMFPDFMNNSSLHLGSPYPEIVTSPASPKYELVRHSTPLGLQNDPLYHKILSYICHPVDANSGKNYLPVIVQVLKKLALAHHEGGRNNNRSSAGAVPRRVHRHTKTKTQRSNSKRKERKVYSSQDAPNLSVIVKEEVIDDNSFSSLAQTPPMNTSSFSPGSPFSTTPTFSPTTDFMETSYNSQSHFQTNSTSHHNHSPLTQSQNRLSPIAHQHHVQQMYHPHQQTDYVHHQTDHCNTSGGLPFEDTSTPLTVNTSQAYLAPLSPQDAYHHHPQSDIVNETLLMPAVSSFPSSSSCLYQQPMENGGSSTFGPMLSPYASSSSSSSPEEVNDDPKEFDGDDTEFNLLIDLINKVGNNRNLESNDTYFKEMLNELSTKTNSGSGDTNDSSSSSWFSSTQRTCPNLSSVNVPSYAPELDMDIDTSLIEKDLNF